MDPEQKTQNKKINKILGSSSCIVVVPDAFPYEGSQNPLSILASALIHELEAYGIVNSKYKKSIADLNNITAIAANQRLTREFLAPLTSFKEEIQGNKQTSFSIILQAQDMAASPCTGCDLIIGTGQGERGNILRPHHSTFPPSLLTRLRLALSDTGITCEPAATESLLCGREENCLNQFLAKKIIPSNTPDQQSYSLLLTICPHVLEKDKKALLKTGAKMAKSIRHFIEQMPLVRMVKLNTIEAASKNDKKFIFRVNNEADANHSLINKAYIEELADSIKQSGLLHPLVLLQKEDGNYKILCGFRRFQAITRLGSEWVEAKVYKENDFSREEFFNISLAENTRRRNLNPVEIGNFLESASQELGLNNKQLAEKFGQTLGIGKPNAKVSQSTVHKYRKVNGIRTQQESPDIITDIINENLQFTIAAEILAPIKNKEDRNRFYTDIVKGLTPTRAQIIEIKNLLNTHGDSLAQTLDLTEVQKGLNKAVKNGRNASDFIKTLTKTAKSKNRDKSEKILEQKVQTLQSKIIGNTLKKSDLNLTRSKAKNKKEITMHIKIRPDNIQETLNTLAALPSHQEAITNLLKGD